MSRAVSELKLKYTNITYFARDKSNRPQGPAPHGSKAGNVNDCIHCAEQQDKVQAGYFLCLDADMIPERDMLRALVAHAMKDSKVAMVTLPQVSMLRFAPSVPQTHMVLALLQTPWQSTFSVLMRTWSQDEALCELVMLTQPKTTRWQWRLCSR